MYIHQQTEFGVDQIHGYLTPCSYPSRPSGLNMVTSVLRKTWWQWPQRKSQSTGTVVQKPKGDFMLATSISFIHSVVEKRGGEKKQVSTVLHWWDLILLQNGLDKQWFAWSFLWTCSGIQLQTSCGWQVDEMKLHGWMNGQRKRRKFSLGRDYFWWQFCVKSKNTLLPATGFKVCRLVCRLTAVPKPVPMILDFIFIF